MQRALYLAIAFLMIAISSPGAVVPNGTLSMAYRQKADGKLSQKVHAATLFCEDGNCALTILTLNQCFDFMGEKTFFPKVERSSTKDGDLRVTSVTSTAIVLQQDLLETTLTYRFDFTTKEKEHLRKLFGLRWNTFFDQITAFSGSGTKDSDLLGKVISWDLVAVKGVNGRRTATIKLDCSPEVDALP